MMRKFLISGAVAAALCTMASPASAADFSFTSAGLSLTFTLPDSPVAPLGVPGQGFITPTGVVVNGNPAATYNVSFLNSLYNFNPGIFGGFSYDGTVGNVFNGAQLYSGTEAAPTFLAGTYTLTQYATGTLGTLVISGVDGGVPEPATWAMMLGGFGLVGGALRRRSVRTSLRYS